MFDPAVVNEGLGQAAAEAAANGSPDGLGAYVEDVPDNLPPPQARWVPPQQQHAYYPQQSMQGQVDFLEPEDTSGGAAVRSAGFTLLFVALGTGIGYAVKGGLGAASGLLLSAGLANAYRSQKWWDSADPSEKHEAIVSGLFAAAELGTGMFVGWKAHQYGEKAL